MKWFNTVVRVIRRYFNVGCPKCNGYLGAIRIESNYLDWERGNHSKRMGPFKFECRTCNDCGHEIKNIKGSKYRI